MAPKADKLQQNIESIQNFLLRKSGVYPELNKLSEEIKYLEKILEQKKLSLQIVGNQEIFNQAMFDLVSSNSEFNQAYNIKYDLIPQAYQQPENQLQSRLILERSLADSTQTVEEYPLKVSEKYLVGRAKNNHISLDEEVYQGVSWQHLEIKAVKTKDEENQYQWQINDLGSSNGTFVNGTKIDSAEHTLTVNDRITLAHPQLKTNIACFDFKQELVTLESEENNNYQEIVDCDLLLLLSENNQSISQTEKEFLTNLDNSLISKIFLVINLSEQETDNQQKTIEVWEKEIESLNIEYKIDLFPVFLKSYYQEEEQEKLSKPEQKLQDKFIKGLANVIKRQPENILASRLSVKLKPLVTPLQQILNEEEQELKAKIRNLQDKLIEVTSQNWKEVTKMALVNVKNDKDKFFKQIKSDLVQAKAAILDNFSKRSVVSQIQDFVDELKPTVYKKQGQPHVKLFSENQEENSDINGILIQFSTSTIEEWASNQWQKINHVYHDGGLQQLLTQIYNHVNIIPDLFTHSPFLSPSDLDIKNNFMISFMGIESELRHKQVSMAGYIMKTLRANMMQVMMMVTMLLALFGQKMGKNQIFGELSKVFKSVPFLLGITVFAIIFFLTNAYNQDTSLKLEEAELKLKKEVSGYYQSLSKNLIEKVIQDINLALEYEASRIDSALEMIQETYNDYILEMEKKQVQIKANLQALQEKEKNLGKEITEFKKLIR